MCQRQNPSVFGGEGTYLKKGEWESVAAFRHFRSTNHYQGTNQVPALKPFGPINTQSLLNLDLTYGLTPRWNLSLDVPLEFNRWPIKMAPPGSTVRSVWWQNGANGLGDVGVRVRYWLFSTEQARANVGLSFGVQAPTGDADVTANLFGQQAPVDLTTQLGQHAWSYSPTVQAFWTIAPRGSAISWTPYITATYLINPQDTTGVQSLYGYLQHVNFPNSSTDQYLVEVGFSTNSPFSWLSPQLSYVIDGVPSHDLIGRSDGFRRPATLNFIQPGFTVSLGRNNFTFGLPIATYINVENSPIIQKVVDATVPGIMWELTYSTRF
ncbi:MAG: hypothetical protein ACRD22_05650 [Terriglobia bacterium]